MTDFPAALPHGPITEFLPNVFWVRGSFRFAAGVTVTRNMAILRQGRDLTLVNSVRLSPEGEAELERLGEVKHLVRLGHFHGMDDPYYLSRYKPLLWALPRTPQQGGIQAARDLHPGSSPCEDVSVFHFAGGHVQEAALIVEREGGILITCDSYQNWEDLSGCSLLGKITLKVMGFQPLYIGVPWLKAMGRGVKPDFDRLLEAPFLHLIPGHGTPIRASAKEGLRVAMAKCFK